MPLAKAYVIHAFYDQAGVQKLFNVVAQGINEYDFDKIRPSLVLLQVMMEAAQEGNSLFAKEIYKSGMLEDFFGKVVLQQTYFYQIMECIIDWVIKVSLRIPMMREWMEANSNSWTYLIDWLKKNPSPPMGQQYGRQSVLLNKSDNPSQCGMYRFNSRRNSALSFYRKNCLIQLKQGSNTLPDLSNEIDIDYYHLDEFKLNRDQKVFVMEDRHMYQITRATVITEMDELVYICFNRVSRDNK